MAVAIGGNARCRDGLNEVKRLSGDMDLEVGEVLIVLVMVTVVLIVLVMVTVVLIVLVMVTVMVIVKCKASQYSAQLPGWRHF
jgi:heme/copper-type cytochrome/quinol oxidase subunit 2